MEKQDFIILNKIISELEDSGNFSDSQNLHNMFLKEAAKKKSKTKKNVPNNPSLWAECKAWAKRTFDVYPSAYANGAAAKRYKSKGGTWKKASSNSKEVVAQNKGGLDLTDTSKADSTYGGIVPPIVDTKRDVSKEQNDNLDDSQQMEDKWSGYKEMSYKDVIEKAKSWLMEGDQKSADSMIEAVTSHVRGSNQLNYAQKNALKMHYKRIKFSLQDTGRLDSGVYNQYYKDANDLIARTKAKFNLTDNELTKDSPSYGLVLNEINKFKSNLKNPGATDRTKNIAFSLLRQLAMDNYKIMKQQGITPR